MIWDIYNKRDKNNSQSKVKPIYGFTMLKQRLRSIGIDVGQAGTWRTVGTVEVLPEDIGKRILFENGGIFFLDDNGVKRRGFMYKKSFYFQYNGESHIPKFHICRCSTIDSFGKNAYRFANAEPIKVFSMNTKREVMVEGIELCGNCRKMLLSLEAVRIRNSTDFVKILKEAGHVKEPQQLELDFYGYVKDWEEISLAYRTKRNFTCERCGIQIEDAFDRQFIHTHHKNGNKTDNREANLECLCIRCHSQADAKHKANFARGANKVLLVDFCNKYIFKSKSKSLKKSL